MSYEQLFRTGGSYNTAGKAPYMLFADQELVAGGYVNNSLEGELFSADPGGSGTIVIDGHTVTPKWTFFDSNSGVTSAAISGIVIGATGTCTITHDGGVAPSVGDVIAINGVGWDATHPFVNGSWVVTAADATTFTFTINAPATASYAGLLTSATAKLGPVFKIYDNRAASDEKGKSFTSVLFTPKKIYDAGIPTPTGYKRVLPSDLYTRFKFQSSSDVVPQGGINSNLFNVLSTDGLNIKPVLWAYFFGYNSSTAPSNSIFEIAFNSYAFVLRPSGDGSKLEFALLKFSWGGPWTTGVAGTWITAVCGTEKFNSYTVSGTDLGYLISTNPDVGKEGSPAVSVVTELAKSDSFTYNSEITPKFNLKITIRKHMLSDSILDGTYLVNLMINDAYDDFGESAHYDTILHAYIAKPSPVYNTTNGVLTPLVTGGLVHDSMLMPIMYFKYNNTNEDNVQTDLPFAVPPTSGASKIVQDSLFFRQINSVAAASYLY